MVRWVGSPFALCFVIAGCADSGGDGGTGGVGRGGGGEGSGGSAVDGGGGAGAAPVPNDDCDVPFQVAVAPGNQVVEHGSLAGAHDDVRTFCADPAHGEGGLPDVVYELDVEEECGLDISLDGDLDGALSLRSGSCGADDTELCVDDSGSHDELRTLLPAGTYWVVVSGHPGTSEDFALTIDCAPSECGDGFLARPEEQCDDGNLVSGDGCDASCQAEAKPPDTCSEAAESPIAIATGEVLHVPEGPWFASLVGTSDSGTGSCAAVFPTVDQVYRVSPSSSGVLTATVGLGFDDVPRCGPDESVEPTPPFPDGCFDLAVHVREESCEDAASEVGCSDEPDAWWTHEEVSIPVTAGQSYFVFVDDVETAAHGLRQYVLRLELE